MTRVLIKRGNLDTKRQTCTQGECHMNIKVKIGVSLSQGMPKIASKSLETMREAWKRFSFTYL